MTSDVLSCPYCNTALPQLDPATAGPRVRCPRCQELFPNRRARDDSDRNGSTAAAAESAVQIAATTEDPTAANRAVARRVLGIMLFMAVVGLVFALWTTRERRRNDRQDTSARPVPVVRAVPPAELPALGYLPPATNVVVGLHVADALRDPAARDLLLRLQQNPSGLGVQSLERWTGLKLDEIDHAVLGLRVDDRLPRVTLAVQTVAPYSPERVREALKATRRTERNGRTLYRFSLEKPPLEAALWFAGERSLVVGLSPQDLDEVPATPQPGLAVLPAPVRATLTQRLSSGALAWAVGHADDWTRTIVQLPLEAALPKEQRQALSQMKSFAVWYKADGALSLHAAIECTDANAAETFDRYLARLQERGKEIAPAAGDSAGLRSLLAALGEHFAHVQKGAWVELQTQAAPEAVRQALAPAAPAAPAGSPGSR